jgi:hypothetical protein
LPQNLKLHPSSPCGVITLAIWRMDYLLSEQSAEEVWSAYKLTRKYSEEVTNSFSRACSLCNQLAAATASHLHCVQNTTSSRPRFPHWHWGPALAFLLPPKIAGAPICTLTMAFPTTILMTGKS